ncbi:hypothetical protein Syun_018974 [Stephania yunnanensis]|uniref:Uncharacterized protein n=1 Tax=Stephania yunnanensis TaxID=152371 RepID=A0AAP0NVH6_9MAGN
MRVLGNLPLLQSTCHSIIRWFPIALHVSPPYWFANCNRLHQLLLGATWRAQIRPHVPAKVVAPGSTPRVTFSFASSHQQLTRLPAKMLPVHQSNSDTCNLLSHQLHHDNCRLQLQRATSHMPASPTNHNLTCGREWKKY